MKLGSRNYPPPSDLAEYIRHFHVFEAELPDGFVLEDVMLSENPFVRILLSGHWEVESGEGEWSSSHEPLLFGPNSFTQKVKVSGSIRVANFAVRPSAWRALFVEPATEYTDHVVPLNRVWHDIAEHLDDDLKAATTDEAILEALFVAIRTQLARVGRRKTDHAVQEFERIARLDSTVKIDEAARMVGLSVRQMERRCMAGFGLSPKAVLRRSRFLDMAEAMRGFRTPKEEELAQLRYFDQSHLNREFHRFSGMTPGKFRKAITPILTESLRLRVIGKSIL